MIWIVVGCISGIGVYVLCMWLLLKLMPDSSTCYRCGHNRTENYCARCGKAVLIK
jgi:predicted amidophosphoribosyltransferase